MGEIKFGVARAVVTDGPFSIDFVQESESLGFSSYYITDHLLGGLECWTSLSAVAAVTSKIRLGTAVLCNSLRNPALLANMAATLDIISKGRLELGIGAGWLKIDYDTCGIPFPRPSVRIAQLEESVEIIKKMWTGDRPSYRGKYYWIEDARCPKPIQKPHPPIMIGGGGEKLILRLVAKHADICNFPHMSAEQCRHKLGVLKKHCRAVGRSFDDIEKSWFGFVLTSPTQKELEERIQHTQDRFLSVFPSLEEFKMRGIVGVPEVCLKRVQEYVDAGITYLILGFMDGKGTRLFIEEVIPKIKETA